MTAGPSPIVNRHFYRSHVRSGRAHLHLQRPSVRLFLQVEPFQSITTNRTKRSHIGRMNAVQDQEKGADHVARENLVKVHAARFALAARARSDYKLGFSSHDRHDEPIHHLRTIATVSVEKYDDFTERRN